MNAVVKICWLIVIGLGFLRVETYSEVKEYFITCEPADFKMINDNPWENIYIPITLTIDNQTWTDVEMRIRGDGTRWHAKRSLKLKFDSTPFINGKSKINFNAEFEDPSYIHQYIASRIFRELGVPCFDSEHIRLYLNNEYLGLYLQIENIDDDFLDARGLDKNANLYKATKNGASLSIFDDIDSLWEKKTNRTTGREDLQELIDIINSVPDSIYYEFAQATFDYENMITMLAMNMILSNASTYYHNYYMYHDINRDGKWKMFPWDIDKTFNTYNTGWHYTWSATWASPDNPYFERAILCEPIFDDVKLKLDELNNSIFSPEYLFPIIDSLAKVLEVSVQEDKTDDIEDDLSKWKAQVQYTKNFIEGRYSALQNQFRDYPKSFKAKRTEKIYTGDVYLSWNRSIDPNGDEITYSLHYDTQANVNIEEATHIYNIKDTFYVLSGLDEAKYFWKVVATDGKYSTNGFDKYNTFMIKKGTELPCVINKNMVLTQEQSPYIVDCNIEVRPNVKLLISEGTEIRFKDSSGLWIYGELNIAGVENNPVIMRPESNTNYWDSLNIIYPTGKCIINNLLFENAVIRVENADIEFNGLNYINENINLGTPYSYEKPFLPIVRIYGGTPKITNSSFLGNDTGEGLLIYLGPAVVENSIFDNIPDPIEYIQVEHGIVHNNIVLSSSDDAIDFNGCSNILITNNFLQNCFDKGISLGSTGKGEKPSENINISNNIIINCGIGISTKESSYAAIHNNTLYNNNYSFYIYEKTAGAGSGKADIVNNIISLSGTKAIFVEDSSRITVTYNICDTEELGWQNNLYLNPLLELPDENNFFLSSLSPCIDAGNPNTPLDPDSTRADIGALYFNQNPPKIIINEINYNSAINFDTGDWVEFYNAEDRDIDISAWVFRDSDDTHAFVFPNGTILKKDGYLVLSRKLDDFKALFKSVNNVIGEMDFGLSGSGDECRLFDSVGRLIDSVAYDDQEPWAIEADGNGASLELINPLYDNSKAENWKASIGYGTPGKINSVFKINDTTVINAANGFKVLSIYPNPADNYVHCEFIYNAEDDVDFEMFDESGKSVKLNTFTIKLSQGYFRASIFFSRIANGIYFLRINSQKNSVVVPFVIAR